MQVEYINHSGYIIETDQAVYVSDYVEGILPAHYLRCGKPLVFMVSNSDERHYSDTIYSYNKTVIIPHDVSVVLYDKLFIMSEGDELHLGFAKIYALPSSQEGLSYLIVEDNKKIFIAGGLNDWHYQDRLGKKQSDYYSEKFRVAMHEVIKYGPFDLMIFPVNPTIGTNYDAGARYAIVSCAPKHFFVSQRPFSNSIDTFVEWCNSLKETKLYLPKHENKVFKLEEL